MTTVCDVYARLNADDCWNVCIHQLHCFSCYSFCSVLYNDNHLFVYDSYIIYKQK